MKHKMHMQFLTVLHILSTISFSSATVKLTSFSDVNVNKLEGIALDDDFLMQSMTVEKGMKISEFNNTITSGMLNLSQSHE